MLGLFILWHSFFNNKRKTLHVLKLLIKDKRCNGLKDNSLSQLELALPNMKYLIIDKSSVTSQKKKKCVRWCKQATNVTTELFGNPSIILAGDIDQLFPISD